MTLCTVATFRSPFTAKFGIPRQSGMVESLRGEIILEPSFRNPDFLRGIEGFSHLWLLWGFSANAEGVTRRSRERSVNGHQAVSPLVRPPVLGGNEKRGVFATRSPFRPNPIGLSSVRIESVEWDTADGPVLHVLGADLMDGTPIYDIKPYLPHTDAHTDATAGFAAAHVQDSLDVAVPDELARQLDADTLATLCDILKHDPRPRYIEDESRVYGMDFAGRNVRFTVSGRQLTVVGL